MQGFKKAKHVDYTYVTKHLESLKFVYWGFVLILFNFIHTERFFHENNLYMESVSKTRGWDLNQKSLIPRTLFDIKTKQSH